MTVKKKIKKVDPLNDEELEDALEWVLAMWLPIDYFGKPVRYAKRLHNEERNKERPTTMAKYINKELRRAVAKWLRHRK